MIPMINKFALINLLIINWSRGEMDIIRVFGTWVWGSSPYETTK